MKSTLYVEFAGNQVNTEDFLAEAKKLWVEAGNKVKDIKAIDLYFKPEEGKTYFVVNGDFSGSF